MNTYTSRDEGITELLLSMVDESIRDKVPHLVKKIKLILTGKMSDHVVLAAGNVWIPENRMARKISAALGDEVRNNMYHSIH